MSEKKTLQFNPNQDKNREEEIRKKIDSLTKELYELSKSFLSKDYILVFIEFLSNQDLIAISGFVKAEDIKKIGNEGIKIYYPVLIIPNKMANNEMMKSQRTIPAIPPLVKRKLKFVQQNPEDVYSIISVNNIIVNAIGNIENSTIEIMEHFKIYATDMIFENISEPVQA